MGKVYPAGTPPKQYLKYYSRQFTGIERFIAEILRFENYLGLSWIQLPPCFSLEQFGMQLFLQQIPPELPLTIEFRHPSWF